MYIILVLLWSRLIQQFKITNIKLKSCLVHLKKGKVKKFFKIFKLIKKILIFIISCEKYHKLFNDVA
jgi:hypothetical protein